MAIKIPLFRSKVYLSWWPVSLWHIRKVRDSISTLGYCIELGRLSIVWVYNKRVGDG